MPAISPGPSLGSMQFPHELNEAVDVAFVLIDAETDAQHVAAHVGDAVPRLELGIPALGVWAAESEEARVRLPLERIEKLGGGKRRPWQGSEQLPLQLLRMPGDRARREPVFRQHPLHGIESIETRRVEGRAHEPHRVLGITDAAGWKRQVLELGVPSGDPWPFTEARRRVHERAAFAR